MANESVRIRFDDRVKDFLSVAPGTGTTLTLDGSPPQGFITLDSADCKLTSGDYVYYAVIDGSLWEIGFGTISTVGRTITRDKIFRSSNSDAIENFTTTGGTVILVHPGDLIEEVNEYVLHGTTTGNSTSNMKIHDITDFSLKEPEADSGYILEISAAVRQTGGGTGSIGHMGYSRRTIIVDNTGGTVTERYDTSDLHELDGGLGTGDFGISGSHDAVNNRYHIQCTGVTDKNLSFTAHVKVIRV